MILFPLKSRHVFWVSLSVVLSCGFSFGVVDSWFDASSTTAHQDGSQSDETTVPAGNEPDRKTLAALGERIEAAFPERERGFASLIDRFLNDRSGDRVRWRVVAGDPRLRIFSFTYPESLFPVHLRDGICAINVYDEGVAGKDEEPKPTAFIWCRQRSKTASRLAAEMRLVLETSTESKGVEVHQIIECCASGEYDEQIKEWLLTSLRLDNF